MSGLDDDRAVRRRAGEQRLERGQEVAPLRVDPDRPVAAEHRDRIGLIGKDAGIARDRIALEAHKAHRVRIVADAAANDGLHPFVREPLVEPVNEAEANLLRQSLNEAVSGGAAHHGHGVALNRHGELATAGFRTSRKSSSTRPRIPLT